MMKKKLLLVAVGSWDTALYSLALTLRIIVSVILVMALRFEVLR